MIKEVIIKLGDPILRVHAKPVELDDIRSPKIKKILETMSKALGKTKNGIGIAAPQIGVPLRIFIASEEALVPNARADGQARLNNEVGQARAENKEQKKTKKRWKHYVFINPKILKYSRKKTSSDEGCLSIPESYGLVSRPEKIKIEAYDERGRKFRMGASGLFARLIQHEENHLNGILFIDKAEKIVKIPDESE